MNKFYLTTAIPYVNAKPHVGFALELVQSDVIKRFHEELGDETLLLSGADENAIKNVQAAEAAGLPVQKFIDQNSKLFQELAEKLNIKFDVFQRGSAVDHHKSSQTLWELCEKNGDIYKKEYTGLYCLGCELFYEPDELNDKGECFEHPGKKLEEVSETNYFFKLSNYQKQIEELLEKDKLTIVPQYRKNEALSFVRQGLKDISISRSNERAKNWGVSVPQDPSQRMYVWFDALNIYQSGVGFGSDEEKYKKWWPADLHVIGKGILRFHAIYWPAFLLSAKLQLPKSLFVHGYLTINGEKMSKSLGNVIDPLYLIDKYGADPLRYYFLSQVSPTGDGDFSEEKLIDVYNADLANGLGNLVARVATLCEKGEFKQFTEKENSGHLVENEQYLSALREYRFDDAIKSVWSKISDLDKYINETKPWELLKNQDPKLRAILAHLVDQIQEVSILLRPFMPGTAKTIEDQFKKAEIKAGKSLFPRVEK